MRITNKMMTTTIKRNVFRQSEQLLRRQEILASGKRSRRVVVSRVAKSLSSAMTSERVRALRRVDLPAFV